MENILVTGASGFLGKEIYFYLVNKNYNVITLGRSSNSDIICDLSTQVPNLPLQKIDYVVHVAGKAHLVPKTDKDVLDFYNVNVKGTQNVLKSLENNLPKTIIFISTVAVYGKDTGEMIDESYPLNGDTAYSRSKILAEEKISLFCQEKNINIVILRPPLITGVFPAGNLKDLINAIKKGYYFRIGSGEAKRSMVSATSIAEIIPSLFDKNGIYNLTDRVHPSLKEIDLYLGKIYGKTIKTLPFFIFKVLAKIGDVFPFFIFNSIKLNKLSNSLTFTDEKAVRDFNWNPDSALKYLRD